MSNKTLDEIRKKLQALEAKKGGSNNFSDKATYPFWDIPDGSQAVARFLPDANEDNTFFWVEKKMIKLPFAGIKGHDQTKEVTVQVPCMEMWDGVNSCPILNEVRPWWKDASLEPLARKYWKKSTFIYQGFVKVDPMQEQDPPENPIRKFIIGPQIHTLIKAALMDPDMDNSPVDYMNGTDFTFSKTSKGGFADYATSKWARKESSLSEDQMAMIAQYGLANLADYLPKKPTPEHLAAITEMFHASVDGEYYDPERWGKYYRPFGFDAAPNNSDDSGSSNETFSKVSSRPSVNLNTKNDLMENDPPFETSKSAEKEHSVMTTNSDSAGAAKTPQQILQMLRDRNKQ